MSREEEERIKKCKGEKVWLPGNGWVAAYHPASGGGGKKGCGDNNDGTHEAPASFTLGPGVKELEISGVVNLIEFSGGFLSEASHLQSIT